MKALVIVDIQHSMGHWFGYSYLYKVYRFLEQNVSQYDKVILTLEPGCQIDKEQMLHIKKASRAKIEQILEATQEESVPSFLMNYLTHDPIYKQYNMDTFLRMKELGLLSSKDFIELPSPRGHYDMYMSQGLRQLVEEVSDMEEVHVIGGGLTKCVELTSRIFHHYQLPHTVLPKVCYDIRFFWNRNYREENVFDLPPGKRIPKRLLTKDGLFSMMEIPYHKEELFSHENVI